MRRVLTASVVVMLALTTFTATARSARVLGATQLGEVEECAGGGEQEPEPSWAPLLAQPTSTNVTKSEVQVPSRDGTLISARTYLPDAFTGPKPTLLIFTPYNSLAGLYVKEFEDLEVVQWADCMIPFMLRRGYAVVLGDMRGTHNSDGCFDFGGPGDQEDGYALVEWIAAQSWSNGNVGMYGVSHPGMSQYAAAVLNPPHLKAIIPIAPITSFYRYLHSNGTHYETNMLTPPAYEYAVAGPPPTNTGDPNWLTNVLGTACNTHNVVRGMSLDGDFTPYWKARDYSLMAGNINAAVYAVHGTLDENVKMDHFTSIWDALTEHDVTRKALIGPWTHAEPNVPWWHLKALRWYEHWLNGNDTGVMAEPRVETIDNKGVSRFGSDWAATGSLTLEAGGTTLSANAPNITTRYRDVPHLPRQLLRDAQGARLLYTSALLQEPLRLLGAPTFDIAASIDTTDTNFVVHLYDFAPNGTAKYVTRGYLDARHRAGLEQGVDVTPSVVEQYHVELHARDYVFEEGHRLQVLLASSDSCHWAVEVGIGNLPMCRSSGIVSDPVPATVSVYEGTESTSLTLPLGSIS